MSNSSSIPGLNAGLAAIRLLACAMLAYGLFYQAMYLGKWYSEAVLPFDDDQLTYKISDVPVSNFYHQIVLFAALPVVLAAALGGLYEAFWKKREAKRITSSTGGEQEGAPSVFWLKSIRNIMHYKFRPLGQYSPWLTVGEFTVLSLWLLAMAAQLWQGVHNHGGHYYEFAGRCEDDPSNWCNLFTGEREPTPQQYRLEMVAIFFGFVASSHFGAVLIPVSRDSKLWSAVGIPFERAVMYHITVGHLAFSSLFLHAFLMVVFWVWYDGWSHAVQESLYLDHDEHSHGIDVPAGWMAFFCAMPMWIASLNFVRRKYYSLFKSMHWLFIGVFLFGAMHWAPNVVYYLGGLSLYTLHVVSRLSAWKRWRLWNQLFGSPDKASPTSLVNVLTTTNYTRLVLRNPKNEPARGGTFVYISVPAALGTDEAHAITVALRGAPPATHIGKGIVNNDVFTVYIKDLGSWTGALNLTAKGAEAIGSPKSLLVDVDGFYSHVDSFSAMLTGGVHRVVVIAGGSGFTSFLGFIQDWCVAAAKGGAVPEIHLAFCCRDIAEMELLGEALPSLLASAGSVKDSHFTMSLYCSAKGLADKGPLSVTWPMEKNCTSISTEHLKNPWASLNYSLQVIIAGGAGYCGWLLGLYEAARRDMLESLHEGAIGLTFMIIAIFSALVIYGWICGFVQKMRMPPHESSDIQFPQRSKATEESKHDVEASASSATFPVASGRVPTAKLLAEEAKVAKAKGWETIKVIASGPSALVDDVVTDARAIDWQLFDTQVFSFEF